VSDGARSTAVIEVRVPELGRLFSAIDPSPWHEKDLDGDAEEFIVGWAREEPRGAALELLVHVDRPATAEDRTDQVRQAIRAFFTRRAARARWQLRALLRVGRTSLLIGIGVIAGFIVVGDVLVWWSDGGRLAEIVRESLMIGGWVAMWRPLEIFLYDWWPIRAEARLYDRLAVMPVTVRCRGDLAAEGGSRAAPIGTATEPQGSPDRQELSQPC
jgi:hypothetical protein